MTAPLVLFDNAFSPYAFKVRATLYEKGIEHEKREMLTAADREALLAVNPRGEVPAISHGDALVSDSSVICEYLETVFPNPPLLPASPAGQARCRLLERLADGPIDGAVITLAVVKMFNPRLQETHPQVVSEATDQVRRLHAHLENELHDDYLCGDYSRADLALVPHMAGAAVLGVTPETPRLAKWLERVSERPAVRRATEEFMAAFRESQQAADPFFAREHLHMRDHRLEWCFRLGLAPWLADEMEAGRLAFSPVP